MAWFRNPARRRPTDDGFVVRPRRPVIEAIANQWFAASHWYSDSKIDRSAPANRPRWLRSASALGPIGATPLGSFCENTSTRRWVRSAMRRGFVPARDPARPSIPRSSIARRPRMDDLLSLGTGAGNRLTPRSAPGYIHKRRGGSNSLFPRSCDRPQGNRPSPVDSPGTSIFLGWRNHDEVRDRRPVRVGHETCI